jgi:tetratricopeptide (TPR) repeat protein
MTRALDELRRRDTSDGLLVYESRAVYEHSIAVLHERRRDTAAARAAYGRALSEDLAYYPAHARLGVLAYASGDTSTALREIGLALELAGGQPALHFSYAFVLAAAGRLDEAVDQLSAALAAESNYALPYWLLGRIRDGEHRPREALEHYRAYLARAARRAPQRAPTEERVAALTSTAPP